MKIAVLVSGGVDSSVALRLLQEEGHELHAFYLKIWLEDELSFLGECPWEDDLSYVRAVCEEAGVPLTVVPFQKEYWERVVSYTIDEVKHGRTPNPDMLCNARIKFGAFLDFLHSGHSDPPVGGEESMSNDIHNEIPRQARNDSFLFDKVATGHYAQVENLYQGRSLITSRTVLDIAVGVSKERSALPSAFRLKMSPDPIKDQTYFLSQLSQAQVAKALFPIGKYEKHEVRALAEKFALPNAKRKDSQGICFLGKIPFDKFLEFHLGKRPGKLIEYETGTVMGEHDGFFYYTVGQRRGIRLSGGPWYVVAKNPEMNEVFISHGEHHELLAKDIFIVGGLNWISGNSPLSLADSTAPLGKRSRKREEWGNKKMNVMVKIRHGAKMYKATIESLEGDRLKVTLKEKDPGLAAGQFAVFYNGEYCLGGGTILES